MQEVEDVMKRELREHKLYEYPRGGMYGESSAEAQGQGQAARKAGEEAGTAPRGRGRGRGGQGGGGGGGGPRGRDRFDRYGTGFDPAREPKHGREKVGKCPYNR